MINQIRSQHKKLQIVIVGSTETIKPKGNKLPKKKVYNFTGTSTSPY